MEHRQIVDQLCEILTPMAKGRVVIDEDTDLTGELALDSLQVMNLVMTVEDQFDISIPINALSDVKTVRDLAFQIKERVGRD